MDVAPVKSSLQAMKKDNKEFIREYTKMWHSTIQDNPPMLEKRDFWFILKYF